MKVWKVPPGLLKWMATNLLAPVLVLLIGKSWIDQKIGDVRNEYEQSIEVTQQVVHRLDQRINQFEETVVNIDQKITQFEENVVSLVQNKFEKVDQQISGSQNVGANVIGSGNTTTQVGSVTLNPKPDLRKDPPGVELIIKRIQEGESLARELSEGKYEEENLAKIIGRGDEWVHTTVEELRSISEKAAQQFFRKDETPGLRTILSGCNERALNAKDNVKVLVNNLRRILELL